jgi:hypothetical protein
MNDPAMLFRLVLLSSFVLAAAGCEGGEGVAVSAPTPLATQPGLSAIGYAAVTGTNRNGGTLTVAEYPPASLSTLMSFQEGGGLLIRFDPSGILWSDQIGDFAGYRPDGSTVGMVFGLGKLLWFDAYGNLYTSAYLATSPNSYVPSISVYRILGASSSLVRSFQTPGFVCTAAADRAGNVYFSTCTATLNGTAYGSLTMVKSNGIPSVENEPASGPVTVDPSGNVYAVYNRALGIWRTGFNAGPPTQSISLGTNIVVLDMAVDRGGNVYVVTKPAPGIEIAPTTLFYIPNGATTATTLNSGQIDSIAAPVL